MRRFLAALLVVLVGVTGYLTLDVLDRVPGWLTLAAAPAVPSQQAEPPGQTGGGPVVAVPAADPAALPLHVAGGAPARAGGLAAAVRARLARALRDPRLGRSVGVTVRDAGSGAHLLDIAADAPRTPASTAKLLAAAAVSAELGPDARFVTRTVLTGSGAGGWVVTLVAGGDTLLAAGKGSRMTVAGRAGLADLAAGTATALRALGVGRVGVRLDDSSGKGPAYAPGWLAADIRYGLTGPVANLGLAADRAEPGEPAPADPPMRAAVTFARALSRAGVPVTGPVARAKAGSGAASLASVASAPVADQLGLALEESDNALTEAVARRAAVHDGARADFGSVARWVERTVERLGVDVAGLRLVDSSGLSRGSAIPVRTLGDVLALAVGDAAPARPAQAGQGPALQAALRAVVAGLPVAGLTGTLDDRYRSGASRAGAGVVRAKTGTLTGVSALAGTLVTRDGRLLVFAVVADRVPAATGTPGARAALDAVTTALAGCGCG